MGRLFALIVAGSLLAAGPPITEDLQRHEKTLQDHGLKSDGASLLDFFRSRTLTPKDRAHLAELVRQLGAENFFDRVAAQDQLIRAGRLAVPLLNAAVKDKDLEVVDRARRCLAAIEAKPEIELVLAALALLPARSPEGACEVLLDFLGCLDTEAVEEDVFRALAKLGFANGRPTVPLLSTLTSPTPRLRCAAGWVLGRSTNKDDRNRVLPLLADGDDRVRYVAAEALIHARDVRGIPGLIALLEKGSLEQATLAESLLAQLAGDKGPVEALTAQAEQRRKVASAWQRWWRDQGARVDWSRIDPGKAIQGLRLIVANSGYGGSGAVWEYGSDRKVRWQIRNVGGPFDARVLPGGRVLLAEYSARKVSERDRTGKVLWEATPSANAPLEVQRLPGGHTLVTTNYEILELDRAGKVVFTHRDGGGNIFSGQKLPNGHIVYGLYSGWLIEIDRNGKQVLKFPIERPRGLANILVLPGGRYVLPLAGSGRIVEMDKTGKVVREVNVASPTSVAVLPNGNWLVGSHILNTVRELDAKGAVVWEHKAEGQVFRVRVR